MKLNETTTHTMYDIPTDSTILNISWDHLDAQFFFYGKQLSLKLK